MTEHRTSKPEPSEDEAFFELVREYAPRIINSVPYAQALGFKLTHLERSRALATAPWREELVGDTESGVIHGGVVTALLDNISGVAVISALSELKSTATLDLRIDYMRAAEKGRDLIGEAECYHVTRAVAFVRAFAYHETKDKLVASASAAFALTDLSTLAPASGKPDQ